MAVKVLERKQNFNEPKLFDATGSSAQIVNKICHLCCIH